MFNSGDLYRDYDVVARRTSQGIVVEHSRVTTLPKIFKSEEELVERIIRSDPNANYILLEKVNG